MRRAAAPILALGVLLPALALAACGSSGSASLPGNAVARVGSQSITKDQFNHWLNVVAVQSAAQGGTDPSKAPVPDPPTYAKCIAAMKASASKPVKGQPTPTDAQYKQQCQQEYGSLRDSVMSFLISASWISQEANKQGVTATDAEVHKQFEQTKKQSFSKEADYQKFLKQSGMTEADLLYRVRLDTLSSKLRDKVIKNRGPVTPAQVTQYYNANKAKFSSPETRDVRVVLTRKPSVAQQAKHALQSGQSWKKVAKKYSVDQQSKNQGGLLSNIQKGKQEQAFDNAVFAAPKGKLRGPLKTPFGYYDYEVEKITPASTQSEKQVAPIIKQTLQQNALTSFVTNFQKEWRGKTVCRQGFVTAQDCSNAPKQASTTTTPAPSGTTTSP